MHDDRRASTAPQKQRRDGVERVVRAKDASLTPAASRLLTRELRDAVGSETVRVAPGRDRIGRRGAASDAVAPHPSSSSACSPC